MTRPHSYATKKDVADRLQRALDERQPFRPLDLEAADVKEMIAALRRDEPENGVVPIHEQLRMALDSQEFYELCQTYRHVNQRVSVGEEKTGEAFEALKAYVLTHAKPFATGEKA